MEINHFKWKLGEFLKRKLYVPDYITWSDFQRGQWRLLKTMNKIITHSWRYCTFHTVKKVSMVGLCGEMSREVVRDKCLREMLIKIWTSCEGRFEGPGSERLEFHCSSKIRLKARHGGNKKDTSVCSTSDIYNIHVYI